MEKIPLDRDKAIDFLKKLDNETTSMNHYIASGAIMRNLAAFFAEDKDYWELIGLLHDIDWAYTKNNIENHCIKCVQILREIGFDNNFIEVVQSHGYGLDTIPDLKHKSRSSRIEYSLASAETITGLIYAYALMRDNKISDMNVKGLRKKFKDKIFAATCDRELIKEIEKTGIDLDTFFELSINAMSNVKDEIGLK